MPADALARCVGDTARFLRDVAGTEPHRHRGDGYEDLLSLDDVDEAIATRGLRHPAIRLVQDGEPIARAEWTKRMRTGSVWVDDLVDPSKLLARHANGATIVLQSLQRWWPPLGEFCRALEQALAHPVQANAYLTPPGAAGLLPHHDTHDVFVMQVHGTKSWSVRAPYIEAPLARHESTPADAARQPLLFEADLAPGDCLYLPRGFVHSARAQQGTSLHLTIGVLAATGHDILRELVDRAADEMPALRRAVPALGEAAVRTADVKVLVSELITWLEHADASTVHSQSDRTAAITQSPQRGRLLDLAALASIDDETVVVVREPAPAVIADGDLAVVLPDRRVVLPVELEPAVHRLLDGSVHRVGELDAMLDRSSRAVLVRRLVREGALRVRSLRA